jgi:hypothetical protein
MLAVRESRMALPPKVCPQCESEYVHTAVVCAHCNVELVDAGSWVPTPARELPAASELALVRAAGMGWVLALSERLVEAEIPHRVEPLEGGGKEDEAPPGPYGVYVREADLAAAHRIDAAHLAREIPEAETADADSFGEDACPACGEPISESDTECGECGLPFGPAEGG